MSERTTIALSLETVDKLKELGRKGQTYNDIINQLLEDAKEAKGS
jgi:hypothetical protein